MIIVIDDYKGGRVPTEYFIVKRPSSLGTIISGRSAGSYYYQVGFIVYTDGSIKGAYSQGGWSMPAPIVKAIYYRL